MKKLIKLFLLAVIFIANINVSNAIPFKHPIKDAVKKASISDSALISISFKSVKTGKDVFDYNSNTPMSPASTQKLVTILPAIDSLGSNYEFKTQLYKNKNNALFLKLGADPYLKTSDLKYMLRFLAKYKITSTKAFSIDDSILDSNEWGEGWQWDNDLNSLMPKFGSYNLDGNLITINVCPTTPGSPAELSTDVFYPTAFMNNVITDDKTDVKLERKNYISPDVITATGTVSKDYSTKIPINYPRRYFIFRLQDLLRKQKVEYYGEFNRMKLPKDLTLISESKHSLSSAEDDILKNSNNMVAETVFKLAGGKYAQSMGSADAAIEMFNDYYKRLGISTDNIKIVDGSGVSKNNLITTDFMTNVLVKEAQSKNFEEFESHMASPGEGTLKDRMLYFNGKLKAKTGTLTNVSAIAGYLTAKNGKNYAFSIIINDPKSKSVDKKSFEEYILREAYNSLK